MDYFNDVLTMFLGLEREPSSLAVYGVSESSRISSKISSLCSKMNEDLTGLEQHEGEYDIIFILSELSL